MVYHVLFFKQRSYKKLQYVRIYLGLFWIAVIIASVVFATKIYDSVRDLEKQIPLTLSDKFSLNYGVICFGILCNLFCFICFFVISRLIKTFEKEENLYQPMM